MVHSTSSNSDPSSGELIPSAIRCAEIVVVRHGETAWNADGRIQGHLDVELNEVGRKQAAAVGDRLSKENAVSAVYSSDLKRAFETAQIIASCCGISEAILEPDLRERHLGDLQGLTSDEALTLKPNAYEACKSPKMDQEIPGGGESFNQLYNRCTSALERIGNRHIGQNGNCDMYFGREGVLKLGGERVVVVTHGGALRALHKRGALNEELPGKILNASVNTFHLAGEHWSIKAWGDISHLSKSGFLETAFGGDTDSG